MPPPPRAGRAPRIPPIFLSLKIDPLKLLTLAVGGRRHVVLPQEVAKLLPKGKLMKEVRARWRDVAFAEAGGGARAVPMAGKAGRGRGLRLPYALQAHCRRPVRARQRSRFSLEMSLSVARHGVSLRRLAWRTWGIHCFGAPLGRKGCVALTHAANPAAAWVCPIARLSDTLPLRSASPPGGVALHRRAAVARLGPLR